ncbi:MAG: M16 family metallopeptidase [Candidatus Acidiferrales bacterium]
MTITRRVALLLSFLTMTLPADAQEWRPPTTLRKLPNGLTVVLSEDHTAPTVGLCISYGIGSRLEPVGRSGFAHLFEHMMFEGTPAAPKGIFSRVVESGGGFVNGETDNDFTQYFESAPVSALDAMLWLEADRMKTLDFSPKNLDNQRNVVEEEVRTNVLNQPYGLFYLFDLPQKAFDKYPNAHNGYGDFKDLDAANIDDVHRFYNQYYAPNNAVLAIVGDFSADEVFAKVEKYFGDVPEKPTPARPDVSEPAQIAERRVTQEDKLAKVPALAVGYRMPPRTTHDAVVGAVTGELLHNGQASRLYQSLVKEQQVALSVSGGLNLNDAGPFEYDGPVLMISFLTYPGSKTQDQVLAAYDAAIAELSKKGPSPAELERIRSKMRADWYSNLELPVSRAQILSHATLFDGTYERAYSVPQEVSKVTAGEVRTFTAKYLVKTNRTIINRVPKSADKPAVSEGAQ